MCMYAFMSACVRVCPHVNMSICAHFLTLPWGDVTPVQAEIKSLSEGAADLDPQEESTAAPYSLYERIRQSARTGPGARGGERGAGSGGIEESLAPAPNP